MFRDISGYPNWVIKQTIENQKGETSKPNGTINSGNNKHWRK